MANIVKSDALRTLDRFAGTKIAGSNALSASASTPSSHAVPVKSEPQAGSIADYKKQEHTPLELQIFKIVEYLRSIEGPATPLMLRQHTKADVLNNPELLEALRDNPKVTVDDANPNELRFIYKPTYQLRNLYELMDFLNSHPDGVEREKLEDAYKSVKEDLHNLKASGKIFEIRNTDKKTYVIYPNCERHDAIEVKEHLRRLWKKIQVPTDEDLQKEMFQLGMKKTLEKENSDQYKKRQPKQQGRRKGSKKRVKYYNTHVTDFDLTAPSRLEARPT